MITGTGLLAIKSYADQDTNPLAIRAYNLSFFWYINMPEIPGIGRFLFLRLRFATLGWERK